MSFRYIYGNFFLTLATSGRGIIRENRFGYGEQLASLARLHGSKLAYEAHRLSSEAIRFFVQSNSSIAILRALPFDSLLLHSNIGVSFLPTAVWLADLC